MDIGDINQEPESPSPSPASPTPQASPDVTLLSLAEKYEEKAATWESSTSDPEATQGMAQGMSQLSHSVAEHFRAFTLATLRLKNRSSGQSREGDPPPAGQGDGGAKANDKD